MGVTFYRRINNGKSVMCRAITLKGAQREATVVYRSGTVDALWEIIGEDKHTILSTRHGIAGKWEDVK